MSDMTPEQYEMLFGAPPEVSPQESALSSPPSGSADVAPSMRGEPVEAEPSVVHQEADTASTALATQQGASLSAQRKREGGRKLLMAAGLLALIVVAGFALFSVIRDGGDEVSTSNASDDDVTTSQTGAQAAGQAQFGADFDLLSTDSREMTEQDFDDVRAQLIGTEVGWRGEVVDVQERAFEAGEFEIIVDVDGGDPQDRARLYVSRNLALVVPDGEVFFTGVIIQIENDESLQVRVDDVTVEDSNGVVFEPFVEPPEPEAQAGAEPIAPEAETTVEAEPEAEPEAGTEPAPDADVVAALEPEVDEADEDDIAVDDVPPDVATETETEAETVDEPVPEQSPVSVGDPADYVTWSTNARDFTEEQFFDWAWEFFGVDFEFTGQVLSVDEFEPGTDQAEILVVIDDGIGPDEVSRLITSAEVASNVSPTITFSGILTDASNEGPLSLEFQNVVIN